MIVHSNRPISTSRKVEKKVEEVKVVEKPVKKSKKVKEEPVKEEEVILPIIEDDFSLIEEEYNS